MEATKLKALHNIIKHNLSRVLLELFINLEFSQGVSFLSNKEKTGEKINYTKKTPQN